MHRRTYTHISDVLQKKKKLFFSKNCLYCEPPILCLVTGCPMPTPSHPVRWQRQPRRRVRLCTVPCVQQWPNTARGTQLVSGLLSLPQKKFTMVLNTVLCPVPSAGWEFWDVSLSAKHGYKMNEQPLRSPLVIPVSEQARCSAHPSPEMDRLTLYLLGKNNPQALNRWALLKQHNCCWLAQHQRASKAPRTYLGFLHDLYEEHVILHGVDDDEDVPEVGGDDAPAVVAGVLGPHDVNLIISQVTELQQQIGSLLIRVITTLQEGSWLTNWITMLDSRNISLRKKLKYCFSPVAHESISSIICFI